MSREKHRLFLERIEGLNDFDPVNYLAIECLEASGNLIPEQEIIDLIEARIYTSLKQIVLELIQG